MVDSERALQQVLLTLADLQAKREIPRDVTAENAWSESDMARIRIRIGGQTRVLDIDESRVEDYLVVVDKPEGMDRSYKERMHEQWKTMIRSFVVGDTAATGDDTSIAVMKQKRMDFLMRLYEMAGGDVYTSVPEYDIGDSLGISHQEVDRVEGYLIEAGMIDPAGKGANPEISITPLGIDMLEQWSQDNRTHEEMAITVLFLAANPLSTERLRLDQEARDIEDRIQRSQHRDCLDFVTAWAVRTSDLLPQLNRHKPHVVHISSHGDKCEGIVLEDNQGNPRTISDAALVSLFQTLKDNIRVVILNACHSRAQAKAITQVVDCAIGMNDTIGDEAARVFASAFYQAIGFGRSVKNAFEQARTQLILEGIREENTPELITRDGVDPDQIVLIPE